MSENKLPLFVLQSVMLRAARLRPYDHARKLKLDRRALSLTDGGCVFPPVSAEELNVTPEELRLCRAWYDARVRTAESPAWDLTVGSRSLRRHPEDWDMSVGGESAPDAKTGGRTTVISLRHKKSGLEVSVIATVFEAFAACEWTVLVKNTGKKRSPVISGFYAADCVFDTGRAELYYGKGSAPAADDFELRRSPVSPLPMAFSACGGRTESFLPFFNLCGKDFGAVAAVGWTGQWYASFRQTARGVRFRAKQERLRAWLEPGESVRSPLVSLTFYRGGNALKGFETFRQMMLRCVCPGSARPTRSLLLANEFCTKTCDELIEQVNAVDPAVLVRTDVLWMDAGWYKYKKEWYDGVGNWEPDPARFPDGIRPLADAIAQKGKRFLLWYEPERVRKGTLLYEEGVKHDGRIVGQDGNLLWNLADGGACAYLTDRISESLITNGVGVYRQDFNFRPLRYWRSADGRRPGITENHYVTNLYRFLDALRGRVPGLIIDNCASGGKRIDIEMCRRGVPFWRSDYSCVDSSGGGMPGVPEATQSMTHGLSFWLPYSGTAQLTDSLYASRSGIMTHPMRMSGAPFTDEAEDEVRAFMTDNYFPLTVGGAGPDRTLAMQFGGGASGAAAVYIRENAPDDFVLRLNGLSENAVYSLTDADDPSFAVRKTGKELMKTGVRLFAKEKPRAIIIKYKVQ